MFIWQRFTLEAQVRLLLALVLVAIQPDGSAAILVNCVAYEKLRNFQPADRMFANSTAALQAEVVAVAPNPADAATATAQATAAELLSGFDQKITFRVLNILKGRYQKGDGVTLIIRVTTVCGGFGCVFPFKVGDVAFLFAPSSIPTAVQGCWIYEGVAMQSILSVPDLPAADF